ncbi:hypothetical protein JXB11_00210 [Candidatus Woesearchaeota archaeon]|nr:hypothetical protein [Candidatus Woesearchaeota archaeon]
MKKGPVKRVNIGLSEDLHTQAKLIAVLTKTKLGRYFEKAIQDAVKRDKRLLEEVAKK